MVAKKLYRRRVLRTRFVRNFMRKLASWETSQMEKLLTITLWKNFWNVVQPSLCSFPRKKSGLADLVTDLSFKEDHTVSEQQQDLLFFNWKWTVWMVCYLQGRQSLLRWVVLKLVVSNLSASSQKGRERPLPKRRKCRPQKPWRSGMA